MNIEHRQETTEFVLIENGQEATLKYSLSDEAQIVFLSTYVPFSLRGRGLAEALVQNGLQWARKQDLVISSHCWYVDKFL